jgi:hypothetical protein
LAFSGPGSSKAQVMPMGSRSFPQRSPQNCIADGAFPPSVAFAGDKLHHVALRNILLFAHHGRIAEHQCAAVDFKLAVHHMLAGFAAHRAQVFRAERLLVKGDCRVGPVNHQIGNDPLHHAFHVIHRISSFAGLKSSLR